MNTAQAHGQRFPPTQETGNEKAEPLLSIQQTSIDHSMDVMIDSSRLVMDNGNSPVGFIEDIFTRLTRRLVFEFLGGHARMEELPCLGDLADGNDEFPRIAPSPAFWKSSQFKLLDLTGNLHLSPIVFIDSDFNPRTENYLCENVLLDCFDAYSNTFISSLEHFQPELISQPADHTIEESYQCSPINAFIIHKTISGLMAESLCGSEVSETQVFMKSDGFSNGIDLMSAPFLISSNQSDKEYSETSVSKMAYPKDGPNIFDKIDNPVSWIECIHLGHPCKNISTDESSPKFSIPDPKHLNEFLYGNLEFPMFSASELPDEDLDTFDYPSLHDDSGSIDDRDLADLSVHHQFSDSECNNQLNDRNRNYDKKTSDTLDVLIGLEDGASSRAYKFMEISDSSNTELLDTHWPTLVNLSSFDVSDHEELLESYGLNNKDEYNDVDYTCESPIWPGKMDVPWNEVNQMKLTDSASNEDSLSSFYDENSRNSVNLPLLVDSSEDYLCQGHPCSDGFRNSIEESIIGTTENPLVYAVPDPHTLNDYFYGNLNIPKFLASERKGINFDRLDSSSLYGYCYSDDCADVANSSENFNVQLLDSDCSSKDSSTFPFDSSNYYELLESYGLNEQDQYTDDFICESPTWPGKV